MTYSFTRKYNGLSSTLSLPVKISIKGTNGFFETLGIIDTGANASVISDNIAGNIRRTA